MTCQLYCSKMGRLAGIANRLTSPISNVRRAVSAVHLGLGFCVKFRAQKKSMDSAGSHKAHDSVVGGVPAVLEMFAGIARVSAPWLDGSLHNVTISGSII